MKVIQARAADAAARLGAELKSAELLKHTAESNIAEMQKQARRRRQMRLLCFARTQFSLQMSEMERRRQQKAVDAEEKEVSSADSD
jgi:hypothetical protein